MSYPIPEVDPTDPKLPEDDITEEDIEEEDRAYSIIETIKGWEKAKKEFLENTTVEVVKEFSEYVERSLEAIDHYINTYIKFYDESKV